MLVSVSEDGREVWASRISTNLPDFDAETRYVDGELVELRIIRSRKNSPPITATGVLRRISTEVMRENTFNAIAAVDHRPIKVRRAGGSWEQLNTRDNTKRYQEAARQGRKRATGRRPEWTVDELLPLLIRFDELLKQGAPSPYAFLTKEWGLEDRPTAARGAIQKAIALGLWKPTRKGRRGGEFTPKAKRLRRQGGK